jgi:ABC-2 type transport system permease protein
MNVRRAWAVSYRYMLLLRGNGTRVFQLFVWGALDITIWGFLTKYLDSVGAAGFSFTPVLLGAVVFYQFMARAQQGISTPFLEDVWSRNLLNFFASPLSVTEYVTGLTLASIITSIIGGVFVTLFAVLVFGLPIWSIGLSAFAFFLILFIFGVCLGIVAISALLRWGPSAEWFVWPIPTIMSPFIGVFYPISVLPPWMQMISKILPASYVFSNLRNILINHTFSMQDLFLGLGLDLIFLALACILFVNIYHRAVQSGAIARYSAESFS